MRPGDAGGLWGIGSQVPNTRCDIDVRFFRPPPEYDGLFSSFYRAGIKVRDGGRIVDHLLPEWGNVRFFCGDSPDAALSNGSTLSATAFVCTGPSSMPTRFELGTTRIWGIGLFPLGWAKFARAPANEVANLVVDGDQHAAFGDFGTLFQALCDGEPDDDREYALIMAHFRERNGRIVPDEERIRAVHLALVDPEIRSVSEFAERAGLGQRMLERICNRHFGFPPRLLLRRQRFMRSLADFMLAPSTGWTPVIDGLYHDQAHFVRDFRSFMGMAPREYAALDHPVLGAFMQERARIWGSAAQTLDNPGPQIRSGLASPK